MSRIELAEMLERFIGDAPDCGDWEWDDFISVKAEPDLEPFRTRLQMASIHFEFDVVAIRRVISELKTNAPNK